MLGSVVVEVEALVAACSLAACEAFEVIDDVEDVELKRANANAAGNGVVVKCQLGVFLPKD